MEDNMKEFSLEEYLKNPDCKVFINRTLLSLKFEWACHNFLYQLHIARERVESVDLNWPLRWWVELLYNVGGFFVWIFVK